LRSAAIWTGLALAASAFARFNLHSWYPRVMRYGVEFHRALVWELLRWNLWLPLAALILRWKRRATPLAYIAAGLLYPALHTGLLVASNWILSPAGITAMLRHRPMVLLPDYLTGIILTSLALGLAYARAEESRAAQLAAQLSQARLEALKMQLQPHFLFNTLNAISAWQLSEPEKAQRMIVRLADFLRLTLENSAVHEVTLDREVDFVARYLEIEKIRFPEKLTVEIAVEPETRCALVPNLILQPIVENAVRHGISAIAAPGKVEISASRRNGSLRLQVRDTGPGASGAAREGRGLSITRGRLDRMYGTAARFSAANAPSGGFQAIIEIPFVRGQQ
jgi:signal transduction histidine kinase